jgi:GGDEF domain-containing protein
MHAQPCPEDAVGGMSNREEFAKTIFGGMMSNGELAALLVADLEHFPAVAARAAVKAADTLLAELAR